MATNAFQRAKDLRKKGNIAALKKLFHNGDAAIKASVLNGLAGNANDNLQMGPVVIELAVEGAGHESAAVRYWACDVFQQLGDYGVDVSAAVEPLFALLQDPAAKVRRIAAYAAGNLCKQKLDWSRHFAALIGLLGDDDLYVPEAAAWALANFSRAKFDLRPAIGELLKVFTIDRDYDEPAKEAAKALLHHAKKSKQNREEVCEAVAKENLDESRKVVKRFVDKLHRE
jgi:hypothetical protein